MAGYGLSILIIIVIGIALTGLCALLVIALGIIQRNRRVVFVGGSVLMVVAGAAAWIFMADQQVQHQSPNQKARTFMQLPFEANVVSFVEGDWAGDAVVRFHLPSTKTHEKWMDEIWRANLKVGFVEEPRQETLSRLASYAGNGQRLWYDATADEYVYQTWVDV